MDENKSIEIVANEEGEIRTIARWKSGFLPLDVFAMRVNCDTQRISPCISLTFSFHMSPEGLENTLRVNLGLKPESLAAEENRVWNEVEKRKKAHIFFARFSMSETLSSVRPFSQLPSLHGEE